MSAAVEPNVASRRAALAIHALGEEDRAWMLGQLQQHRTVLEPLLAELQALGIQPDRHVLAQYESGPNAPGTALTRLIRLDRAMIRQLACVLEQEPAEVTRALLAAGDPAWRSAVLKALGPSLSARVNAVPSMANGPALLVALAAGVERRLNEVVAANRRRTAWRIWSLGRRTA